MKIVTFIIISLLISSSSFAQIYLGNAMDENAPIITEYSTDVHLIQNQLKYCRIIPSQTDIYTMSSSGGNDTYARIYNSASTQLAWGDDEIGSDFSISIQLTANETYYLGIGDYDGNNVSTLFVSGSILPVELTSFTANLLDDQVELFWETETEVNNYGFEILRCSTSQNDIYSELNKESEWMKVGFVSGHGNSNSPKMYSFSDKPLMEENYKYRLKQIDIDGKYEYSSEIEVKVILPKKFLVQQNYPNPFNPTTNIKFTIPEDNRVNVNVFNSLGEEVAHLLNEYKEAGTYSIEFNANELSSGIYYYRIACGDKSEIKKMILLR